MGDGKLVVLSPSIGLTDGLVDDLLQFGEVGAIVATNGFHYLGQPEWRARFPEARFFAPPEAAVRIANKCPEVGSFEPLSALQPLLGDNLGVREAPATRIGETWAWAKTDKGNIWYASDVLANMPTLPSHFVFKRIFKWTGSAPGFRIFGLAMKFVAKDKKKMLAQFSKDIEAAPPTIVVPAHGDIVDRDTVAQETRDLLANT
ncbi:MAG: hypothetical protein ACJAYU_004320 [Bradymonadia bacterium]|jgi:hypothetical protein